MIDEVDCFAEQLKIENLKNANKKLQSVILFDPTQIKTTLYYKPQIIRLRPLPKTLRIITHYVRCCSSNKLCITH